MRNPIFNKQHITEYLLYGLICAIVYIIPVIYFLDNNKYENLYYLYIGNGLFMFVIFYYAFRLLYRKYDGKRAASMLIAGNLATVAGVALSCIFVAGAVLYFFSALFSSMPTDSIIQHTPTTIEPHHPGQLLLMILFNAIIINFGVGAFISVVTAYVGKKEQRKDKPESLQINISAKEAKA